MTYASILNTLGSYERQFGAATFSIRGTAKVRKHDVIAFDNLFSGDQASLSAAAYVVAPITYLLSNDYESADVEGVDVTVVTTEKPRTATLERVWLDDPRPRAGRPASLKVLFRTYRGDEVVRTLPIDIPGNASGALSILVSDGARLGQNELRETRQQPRGVDQMIKSLNKARRNNTLYVKLLGVDAGAVVNGELLSSLPPSVLGVLEGDRNGGNFNPLRSADARRVGTGHRAHRHGQPDAHHHRLAQLRRAHPRSSICESHSCGAPLRGRRIVTLLTVVLAALVTLRSAPRLVAAGSFRPRRRRIS